MPGEGRGEGGKSHIGGASACPSLTAFWHNAYCPRLTLQESPAWPFFQFRRGQCLAQCHQPATRDKIERGVCHAEPPHLPGVFTTPPEVGQRIAARRPGVGQACLSRRPTAFLQVGVCPSAPSFTAFLSWINSLLSHPSSRGGKGREAHASCASSCPSLSGWRSSSSTPPSRRGFSSCLGEGGAGEWGQPSLGPNPPAFLSSGVTKPNAPAKPFQLSGH